MNYSGIDLCSSDCLMEFNTCHGPVHSPRGTSSGNHDQDSIGIDHNRYSGYVGDFVGAVGVAVIGFVVGYRVGDVEGAGVHSTIS